MSFCASTTTSTATIMYPSHLTAPVFGFVLRIVTSPPLIASKHRRSFIIKVLVKELSVRSIIVRWRYPFPWHYAWKGYAYASGAIDPVGCRSAGELLAKVGGKMVAILGE